MTSKLLAADVQTEDGTSLGTLGAMIEVGAVPRLRCVLKCYMTWRGNNCCANLTMAGGQ